MGRRRTFAPGCCLAKLPLQARPQAQHRPARKLRELPVAALQRPAPSSGPPHLRHGSAPLLGARLRAARSRLILNIDGKIGYGPVTLAYSIPVAE